MTQDEKVAFVRAHVSQLMEHFDAVQIFTSKYEPETGFTESVNLGAGNTFAREGQIKEWIIKSDTIAECQAIDAHEDQCEEDAADKEEDQEC